MFNATASTGTADLGTDLYLILLLVSSLQRKLRRPILLYEVIP